ncbi:DUF2924 domain-containing protein [Roseobacter denitrificans]|nr:DUF2924 domain-containing protein [Roseobacter denitrificans]
MGRDPNPERPAACAQWEAVFGSHPPPYLSVPFMQKAISYEAQCKPRGGLPAAARRALNGASYSTCDRQEGHCVYCRARLR